MESCDQKTSGKEFDEKKSNKQITAGAIAGYFYLLLQILSGFFFVPLISKHYGQNLYGVYTLANSFVSLFVIDIGLSAIANRYLSQYRALGKSDEIASLLGLIYKIYICLSLFVFLIFVAGFFISDFVFVGLTNSEKAQFKEMYIVTSCFSVLCFGMQGFDGVLNAYEEYLSIKLFNILERTLYIVFCGLALWLNWNIVAISIISSGATCLCYVGKYFVIRFKTGIRASFKSKLSKDALREILSFSSWNLVVSICYRLNNYLASPILGIVSDSQNVAIYNVGAQIELYAFMISGVLNGLFVPKISRIFALYSGEERSSRLTSLAKQVGLIISSLFMIIFIGFICCGQEFLDIWMDDVKYFNSYWVAVLLMFGQAFCAPLVVWDNALWFDGNIKYEAYSRIASLIVFGATAFPLGYFLGAIGVSISISLGLISRFVLIIVYSRKKLKSQVWEFMLFVVVRQIPAWIAMIALGLSLHYFVRIPTIYKLILIICSISFMAVVLYWFFIFPKSLRKSLLSIFKK